MVDTRYDDIIYKSRFDAEHQARHNSHIFSNSGLYKPSLSKDLPKDAMVEDMKEKGRFRGKCNGPMSSDAEAYV